MAKEGLSGKLAVILHADVAGSTTLVQQDKELAHERIQDAFKRFSTTIEKYQGKVVELRGDALLAEFERASDAVSAALSFQSDHAYHNTQIKDDLRPTVRVGIATGEVIIADNTVTGAGVVQAQRVEQLADPGGVCITAAIHESLSKRMPFDLDNLGEQVLKGFDDPVRVYRVELSAGESVPLAQQASINKTPSSRPGLMLLAIVIALAAMGGAAYWFNTQEPKVEAASFERMAFPLPDKPSIAVLPFTNMSDDKQQEYFADGMTEDLITDISKVSGLFVIARNSVFTYKGKAVKVRQVAEELGVRYVLEGSVRRVSNQVRINAQLIDATTGGHIWADRYDGSLDDVFTMQDKITRNIVDALSVTLTSQDNENQITESINSEAHDAFLRGWGRYRQGTPEDYVKAISFFEKAIALDPNYAEAYSALAAVDWSINFNGWARVIGLTSEQPRARSQKSIKKAMERPSALTYRVSSERSSLIYSKPDKALKEAGQAIALDSNNPAGHVAMAGALLKARQPAEAVKSIHTAMRLDPIYPAYYLNRLAEAYYALGQYQDAAETLVKSITRNPENDWTYVYLTATYGELGDTEKAKQALAEANKLRAKSGWGELTVELAADRERRGSDIRYIFKWFGDLKPLRASLRKAGVPEGNEWKHLVKYNDGKALVKGAVVIDNSTAKELHERGVQFVDIWYQWGLKRIPNSHYLNIWAYDYNEISLSEIVRKDQEIVIYGSRVSNDATWLPEAVALAVQWGFEKVYHYQGGMSGWENAGYPVDRIKIEVTY
jgi:TolB-like protein/class 3 adenylate cyclase/Flp pilus assembly protein TadD/rhodanese-related sulfurtransferase